MATGRSAKIMDRAKTKTETLLPKTAIEIRNGGLYSQRVRCGKPNCKCAVGERHQGFYFFTRRGGKLTKRYVRKKEVEAFAMIVAQSAVERSKKRRSAKLSNKLLLEMRIELSRNEGHIKKLTKG